MGTRPRSVSPGGHSKIKKKNKNPYKKWLPG